MQKTKRSQILASLLTGSMIFGGLINMPIVYAENSELTIGGGTGGISGAMDERGEDGASGYIIDTEKGEIELNNGTATRGGEPDDMSGGDGGRGGDANYNVETSMSYGTIGVLGGIGGYAVDPAVSNNNFRGKGGNGGNAIFTTAANIDINCDTFALMGGNSGDNDYMIIGNTIGNKGGGNGGKAIATINGTLKAKDLWLDSGGIIANNPKASGGSVDFYAKNLNTEHITIYQRNDYNNELKFNVDNLNVIKQDTLMEVAMSTQNNGNINIKTAKIGEGSTLSVDNQSGRDDIVVNVDKLSLVGKGNFNDIDNIVNIGQLSMNGGVLDDDNWQNLTEHLYTNPDILMEENGMTVNVDQNRVLNHNIVMSATGNNEGYSFTKIGSGTLDLNSIADYSGMTIVREGKLNVGSNRLANSAGLALYGGATFDHGTADVNWDGKQLLVDGSNNLTANYIGDLSAQNSDLYFISSVSPTEPLLSVDGNVNISNSKYNVGLSGGTQIADGTKLTLIQSNGTLTADNITKGEGFDGVINIGSTIEADITNAVQVSEDGENLVIGEQEPTDPENPPVDPDQPTDPDNPPVDPDQPTDPDNPPIDPDQPTDPDNPSVDPDQPIDPDNPGSGGSIVVDVSGSRAKSESKMLSEGFLGGLAFNLQGADLIADRGINSAIDVTNNENSAIFAQISRGSIDYETGSSVDMDGTNMLLGTAWKRGTETTMGIFAEYGDGSYDTKNNFNGIEMRGSGDTSYFGGGLLARRDFSGTDAGHYYLEGSMRLGRTDNEYTNSYLHDSLGRIAHYDIDGMYYGMHVGAGYLRQIDEHRTLDMYGKLLWTRQEGDTTMLSTGEKLNFSDIDSWRWRMGARFNYNDGAKVGYYAGLAWEHEFDGEASASVNNFVIDKPSLKGDSGIVEIGLNYRPSIDNPWILNLNVQNYFGARDGWRGGVEATYMF